MKLWAGRFSRDTDKKANDFNSSLSFDKRLFAHDIRGSIAHAKMLGKTGIIASKEASEIVVGLLSIRDDISSGNIDLDNNYEDIHMAIEEILTERIGRSGKKLHTARSRNDQVALDTRLYIRDECTGIISLLNKLCLVLIESSKKHLDTIMPGFTHMQPAQPVTLALHIMAYFEMFARDMERLADSYKRINSLPLGSCALAGTGFPIDRQYVADLLGFDRVSRNSMDAVSDRDYVIEFVSALAIISMHLSRFCEELIVWNSFQFSFVEQDDSFSTGSSIMPQKKNPDIAELVRGKTGRVYGNLLTILTVMKGLPLSYNKDMQEDKPALFDSIDTVSECLEIFTDMFKTLSFNKDSMYESAGYGYINATDLADYLVLKNIPFRSAHEITGRIVAYCVASSLKIEDVEIDILKTFSPSIEKDIYEYISLENCIDRRSSHGGPSFKAVEESIAAGLDFISQFSEYTE